MTLCQNFERQNKSDRSGWIAVYVAPQSEQTVSKLLGEKGYEEFCPTFIQMKKWSDRTKLFERPLFPRYVFCRISPRCAGPIVTTPGVVKILGQNGAISFVPDDEISALKSIHHLRFPVATLPLPYAGKQVVVRDGPLQGLRGRIMRIKNDLTLVIAIEILQRAVAVTLPKDSVLDDNN
jgi:transcription antitermination factor NusG